MADDETFDIVNFAFNLGNVYVEPKLVKKILRSLIEDFRPKVTAIIESKNVDTISMDELVGSLQTYESDLPRTNKSISIALKSVDDVDENVFGEEISFTEIGYLAKHFRNFLKNNNKRERNKNFANPKNVKKNEQPIVASSEKPNFTKDKVGQSSNNSSGQQCFG